MTSAKTPFKNLPAFFTSIKMEAPVGKADAPLGTLSIDFENGYDGQKAFSIQGDDTKIRALATYLEHALPEMNDELNAQSRDHTDKLNNNPDRPADITYAATICTVTHHYYPNSGVINFHIKARDDQGRTHCIDADDMLKILQSFNEKTKLISDSTMNVFAQRAVQVRACDHLIETLDDCYEPTRNNRPKPSEARAFVIALVKMLESYVDLAIQGHYAAESSFGIGGMGKRIAGTPPKDLPIANEEDAQYLEHACHAFASAYAEHLGIKFQSSIQPQERARDQSSRGHGH